jgi:hypothetical protein
MTVILPMLLVISGSPIVFGGAKPVPIDPRYFATRAAACSGRRSPGPSPI